jgi:hypothetical protein
MPPLGDLVTAARLAVRMPGFLRCPVTPSQARVALAQRLERRAVDFLGVVRRAIYGRPASPYRRLLALAGCEYGDLEHLVHADGLERALGELARRGVYLTIDEFKGRRPIVRGGTTIPVTSTAFHNPRAAGLVPARSGGSRSPGTAVLMDLGFLRECATDVCLFFEARGGLDWVLAQWQVPGSGVIARLLEYASFGQVPARWFSQVDPGAARLSALYRWSPALLRLAGRLAGRAFPRPDHVSVEASLPIARWMAETLAGGRTPHLHTFVSSAVRMCRTAEAAGLDLRGAEFLVTGEPLTRAQRATIEATGAGVVTRYGIVECGAIGFGCLRPAEPDAMHVVGDLHAVVHPPPASAPGLPARALLLSSLRPAAPLLLLNVSMGDEASLGPASCGCPLASLGWTQALHGVRSHEKLTAGGMTVLDAGVIRVLEEILPARFGGGPTDYQLVEDRDPAGAPRLRLLVHPGVGPVDGAQVREAFLEAVAAHSESERVMSRVWRDAGILGVERRSPVTTRAGKILHLHVEG